MAERGRMPWWRRWPARAWACVAEGGWLAALCRALVLGALLGLGALLFVAAGLVPVAASEGHWAITRVLLQFAMHRSVHTHTLGVQAPSNLDDPRLVLKGAGHYASSCMPCHGAPGRDRARVVLGMTPRPPFLPAGGDGLGDEELFWIVRHGIKYTAMPAWPALAREDEVWAMVAFLRAQPSMDPATYRALAYGDSADRLAGGAAARVATLDVPMAQPSGGVLADCARCHGADGMGRGDGAYPRLAGLDADYLAASLRAFAAGERHSGFMEPVAAGLAAAQVDALARHYAALPGAAAAGRCDAPEAYARGATLAASGDPARKVPACDGCHADGDRNPLYPALAGQHADYLALQLRLFRDTPRGGSAYAGLMEAAAAFLGDRDIRDLATYYAAQPAGCP